MEIDSMYEELGISRNVLDFGTKIETDLKTRFEEIDKNAEYNQMKVIKAMQDNRVSDIHFAATTGYGYNDLIGPECVLDDAGGEAAQQRAAAEAAEADGGGFLGGKEDGPERQAERGAQDRAEEKLHAERAQADLAFRAVPDGPRQARPVRGGERHGRAVRALDQPRPACRCLAR